jgi:CBS domain-containing protein
MVAALSWAARLKNGLARTREVLNTPVSELFVRRRVDESLLQDLETALLQADCGVAATDWLLSALREKARKEHIEEGDALKQALKDSVAELLRPLERQLEQRRRGRPQAGPGDRPRPASRVAEVMSREVRLASPEDTVQQATRLMREADTGVLPVGEADRLVGMLTDRDVALRLVADGKDPARTKVREVMTAEVRYVFEDEDLHRAAESMAAQQVRRLPVVTRSQRLVGMVSLGDLAAAGRTPRLAGRALAGIAQEGGRHDQTAAG